MALALRSTAIPGPAVPERRPHLAAVPAPRRVPARPADPGTCPSADVHMLYPPVDAGPAAPFRLTRRGLVVVSALVGALCAALVWVAAWSAATARAADRPRPIASSPITVRPGDTLWSIAARVAPSVDPRAEVALLQRVNHLSSAALVPGQRIRLG